MYQTLFEAESINIIKAIVLLLISIVSICAVMGAGFYLYRKKKVGKSTGVIGLVFSTLILIYCSYCIIQVPMQKEKIYDAYVSGNSFSEEGMIQIVYQERNIDEYYFIVNNVVFSLDDRQAYNFSCRDNELCVYDGQQVKITYVKYKNKNLVMKIEAFTEIPYNSCDN